MNEDIKKYIEQQSDQYQPICKQLASLLSSGLPAATNKLWHGHPVWFNDDNPITGFSIQKAGVRLLFWSGMDFNEPKLQPGTGKFKDASIFYRHASEVDADDVQRWLEKSCEIQWDYKNIVKNKGLLKKLQ